MNIAECSHVYAIQVGEDGPIKIGIATDPKERLKTLQTAHHRPLRLIGYSVVRRSWALEWERKVHERIKAHRLQGEWFECHRVVQKLAELIAHGEVLRALEVPLPGYDVSGKVWRKLQEPIRASAAHPTGSLFEHWELANPGLRVNHDRRVPLPAWATGATC